MMNEQKIPIQEYKDFMNRELIFSEQFDKICEDFVRYELCSKPQLSKKCENCKSLNIYTKIIFGEDQNLCFCPKCKRVFNEEEIEDYFLEIEFLESECSNERTKYSLRSEDPS